jgi:hypothetical protein
MWSGCSEDIEYLAEKVVLVAMGCHQVVKDEIPLSHLQAESTSEKNADFPSRRRVKRESMWQLPSAIRNRSALENRFEPRNGCIGLAVILQLKNRCRTFKLLRSRRSMKCLFKSLEYLHLKSCSQEHAFRIQRCIGDVAGDNSGSTFKEESSDGVSGDKGNKTGSLSRRRVCSILSKRSDYFSTS